MIPHFYYSTDILDYDFGPQHPLKPERLRRTIELLGRYEVETLDPEPRDPVDALRVHDAGYLKTVKALSDLLRDGSAPSQSVRDEAMGHGFGSMDNPPFAGMYEASLAYVAATARAAEAVRDGAPLAFGIGGGLHHALRSKASGFCIFNDPAVACHILRERFERVAYVDIDVHHGDGVQWIFYEDPSVLTCSIHEDPRSLFPGTGGVDEMGAEYSALNVPIRARTTGDVWLEAFRRTIPPAVRRFDPGAVVLQLGTDTHFLDPLAHIDSTQGYWLEAVREVMALGLPLVAVGGGGYNLQTVPRMWVSACLTLGGVPYDDRVPGDLADEWGMPTYSDQQEPVPGVGREHAEKVVDWLTRHHRLLGGGQA
jgi:acetoin utilization protein AcuC